MVLCTRHSYTRNVEAFLEKTAIAYRQNVAFFLEFGWHAIAVFSKNATTLRVDNIHCAVGAQYLCHEYHTVRIIIFICA